MIGPEAPTVSPDPFIETTDEPFGKRARSGGALRVPILFARNERIVGTAKRVQQVRHGDGKRPIVRLAPRLELRLDEGTVAFLDEC